MFKVGPRTALPTCHASANADGIITCILSHSVFHLILYETYMENIYIYNILCVSYNITMSCTHSNSPCCRLSHRAVCTAATCAHTHLPLPSLCLQTPEPSMRDSPTPANEQEAAGTAETAGEEKEPGTKELNVEETEGGAEGVKLENNVEGVKSEDKSSEDGVKEQPVIEVPKISVVMETASASEQSKGVVGEGEGEEKEIERREGDGGTETVEDGGAEREREGGAEREGGRGAEREGGGGAEREEEEFDKFESAETGRVVEDVMITADYEVVEVRTPGETEAQ